MGLDHFDMVIRIEDAFGFRWERNDDMMRLWEMRANKDVQDDCTAGDVHAFVCLRLRELGRDVPPDSWRRVQEVLAAVQFWGNPDKVTPESYLKRDLGFC